MRPDKLRRMSRRKFLNSLAAIGVSGVSYQYATRDAVAAADFDPENEVPVLKGVRFTNREEVVNGEAAPKKEPIYYSVPRDDWVVVESARDAAAQIRESLEDVKVDVGVSTITRGQRRQKAVVVKYRTEQANWTNEFEPEISFEELQDRLPATVEGVAGRGTEQEYPVEEIPVVAEMVESELMVSFDYDCNYRPIPAGAAWRTEAGNPCTTGTPVYDADAAEYRIVTASHCFYDYGTEFRQNSGSGDHVGARDPNKIDFRHNPLFDAAVVDLQSDVDVRYRFADDTCSQFQGHEIDGYASESHLNYLENNNGTLRKQGIRTGRSSGPVTYVSSSAFEVNTNHGGGDSGCPFFSEYATRDGGTNTMIAGVLRGGSGNAEVTQMENIVNRWNLVL